MTDGHQQRLFFVIEIVEEFLLILLEVCGVLIHESACEIIEWLYGGSVGIKGEVHSVLVELDELV